MALGVGFKKLARFGNGVRGMMDLLTEYYFVPGTQVLERHICGKSTPLAEKRRNNMSLTSIKYQFPSDRQPL